MPIEGTTAIFNNTDGFPSANTRYHVYIITMPVRCKVPSINVRLKIVDDPSYPNRDVSIRTCIYTTEIGYAEYNGNRWYYQDPLYLLKTGVEVVFNNNSYNKTFNWHTFKFDNYNEGDGFQCEAGVTYAFGIASMDRTSALTAILIDNAIENYPYTQKHYWGQVSLQGFWWENPITFPYDARMSAQPSDRIMSMNVNTILQTGPTYKIEGEVPGKLENTYWSALADVR